MNAAQNQVRAGDHLDALLSYIAIWEEHGSVAAAINASIIYEALGETEDAAALMEYVFIATMDPRASAVLSQLSEELVHQRGVETFNDMRPSAERVAAHALNEVGRVLPYDARVWIQNNAATNQSLVSDVIDNMTSSFLNAGTLVVERQMIDMVLEEQNLHLGGNVTDGDFISVGNLAGANTIVVVGITGTGHMRRLQVRVLDIETSTVVMQSGTGVDWRL